MQWLVQTVGHADIFQDTKGNWLVTRAILECVDLMSSCYVGGQLLYRRVRALSTHTTQWEERPFLHLFNGKRTDSRPSPPSAVKKQVHCLRRTKTSAAMGALFRSSPPGNEPDNLFIAIGLERTMTLRSPRDLLFPCTSSTFDIPIPLRTLSRRPLIQTHSA